jgi:adenylate cyclase
MNRKVGLIKELQRRNVFKVAIAYVVSSWLLAQVVDLVLDNFHAPDWAMKALLVALAIGFPISLIISWVYEVTEGGVFAESQIDRTISITDQSGKRLDRVIILILAIVIVFMGLERFVFSRHDTRPSEPASDTILKTKNNEGPVRGADDQSDMTAQ